jgi:signal transduction histidine kinase
VRPEVADQLVIGGLPRSRLPLLPGLFGVAVALGIVAVGQLRREGELARLRGDFVSSVSHELRTPLAQVRLSMETLRLGRYRTEEQRAWIMGNMDREVTRLVHLVDRVLLFSRSERGIPHGTPQRVEVAAEVAEVVESFRPLARGRRARLATSLAAGVEAEPECFEDGHSASCGGCIDEAERVAELSAAGKSLQEIRAAVDAERGGDS